MIQSTLFVLAVPNLERSGAFYREALGFEIRELGDPGWRMFVRDNCKIMAGECPNALPAAELGDHSYFGYLVVDDVDAYYQRVLMAKAEIIKPVTSEPWGMREFGLRTIDGHRLMVGQDL
jgi:predicted enzyme related to lactoylglutathione lyase